MKQFLKFLALTKDFELDYLLTTEGKVLTLFHCSSPTIPIYLQADGTFGLQQTNYQPARWVLNNVLLNTTLQPQQDLTFVEGYTETLTLDRLSLATDYYFINATDNTDTFIAINEFGNFIETKHSLLNCLTLDDLNKHLDNQFILGDLIVDLKGNEFGKVQPGNKLKNLNYKEYINRLRYNKGKETILIEDDKLCFSKLENDEILKQITKQLAAELGFLLLTDEFSGMQIELLKTSKILDKLTEEILDLNKPNIKHRIYDKKIFKKETLKLIEQKSTLILNQNGIFESFNNFLNTLTDLELFKKNNKIHFIKNDKNIETLEKMVDKLEIDYLIRKENNNLYLFFKNEIYELNKENLAFKTVTPLKVDKNLFAIVNKVLDLTPGLLKDLKEYNWELKPALKPNEFFLKNEKGRICQNDEILKTIIEELSKTGIDHKLDGKLIIKEQ